MTTQPKTNQEKNKELTREEALAILNTPDDQLDELIAQAEKLPMPEVATAPRTVLTAHNPAVHQPILRNINGFPMRNFTVTMIL